MSSTLTIKFMALSGPFKTVREQSFETTTEAMAAVVAHAQSGGYTDVKRLEDADSWRFTARTPGGRSGRNIAFMDLDFNPDEEAQS